jgi:DNA-directed RNA polymerase specialized sigma24 family protein
MTRQRGRGKQTGLPRNQAAMTFEEIAEVLGITRGGVWMAYKRAMRKMRRKARAIAKAEDR